MHSNPASAFLISDLGLAISDYGGRANLLVQSYTANVFWISDLGLPILEYGGRANLLVQS